jgi:methyl-accepting chemotaxis protein
LVLDKTGRCVAATDETLHNKTLNESPQEKLILATQTLWLGRASDGGNQVAAPIMQGKDRLGVVCITYSIHIINQTIRASLVLISGISLAALIIGEILFLVMIQKTVVSRIQMVTRGLEQNAYHVSTSGGQISGSSQSVAQGASEQASSLQEIGSSLEEMSGMTQRNAQNAQSAKEFTAQTRKTAEAGAASAKQMGEAMQGIKTSSAQMREAMHGIKAASGDVSKIIKTIDEIAFQTNILALNAAVEAARAGEAGMGFAVVADEVRNLAQRSAKAARETTAMIETSIQRSEAVVHVTEKVTLSVEEVAAKSRQLEEKLAEILSKAQQVDEQVAQIASASAEQSEGISHVSAAVAQMDKVTQDNAANSQESAAAVEELNAQAAVLRDAVLELQKLVGGQAANDEPRVKLAAVSVANPASPRARVSRPASKSGSGNKENGHKSSGIPSPQMLAAHHATGSGRSGKRDFRKF